MNPLLRKKKRKGTTASRSRRQFLRATVQKSSLVYLRRLKTHFSRLHEFPPPHHPQHCNVRIHNNYNMLQLLPQINVTLILSGYLVLKKNNFLFCFVVHDTPWKQDGVTQCFYEIRISLKHWKRKLMFLRKVNESLRCIDSIQQQIYLLLSYRLIQPVFGRHHITVTRDQPAQDGLWPTIQALFINHTGPRPVLFPGAEPINSSPEKDENNAMKNKKWVVSKRLRHTAPAC